MAWAASLILADKQIVIRGYDMAVSTFSFFMSFPGAKTLVRRSLSVTMPTGVSYFVTIRLPMCFSPMVTAASAMEVSGVTVKTSLVMISLTSL